MPLEVFSSEQAWETAYRNKLARYPTPNSGLDRLYPFPAPETKSTFKFPTDAKIFSIGSCFAGSLDVALVSSGMNIISRSKEVAEKIKDRENTSAVYNKYTLQSVLNEVRWALDPSTPYPGEGALTEMGEGKWTDLNLGGATGYYSGPKEEILALREAYSASVRKIAEADVVILTLGLVESWYDKQLGIHLNVGPSLQMVDNFPDRYEFHTYKYGEMLQTIEDIYQVIKKFGKPGVKFIVTVDPVPLIMTYRDRDVIVANAYSKSLLRAVAEEFVMLHDDVDYFPTYEFVYFGEHKQTYGSDFRHVSAAVVRRIVAKMISKYLQADQLIPLKLGEEIKLLSQDKDYPAILEKVKKTNLETLDPTTLFHVATAHKDAGDKKAAFQLYLKVNERAPTMRSALASAITLAKQLSLTEEMNFLLAKHEATFPADAAFRAKFGK